MDLLQFIRCIVPSSHKHTCHSHIFCLIPFVECPLSLPSAYFSSLQTGFIYTKTDTKPFSICEYDCAGVFACVWKQSSIISKHCNHSVHSMRTTYVKANQKPKPMCLLYHWDIFHVHIIRIQLLHTITVITLFIYKCTHYTHFCSVCCERDSFARTPIQLRLQCRVNIEIIFRS